LPFLILRSVADEGVAPSKHPLFGEDHLRDEALMKPVKGHRIPKDGQTPLKLFDKEELLAQMGWQQATKHSKRYTLTDQVRRRCCSCRRAADVHITSSSTCAAASSSTVQLFLCHCLLLCHLDRAVGRLSRGSTTSTT
jgi:hypothetical protein